MSTNRAPATSATNAGSKKKGTYANPSPAPSKSSESQDFRNESGKTARSSSGSSSPTPKAKKVDTNSTPNSVSASGSPTQHAPLSMMEFPPMKEREGSAQMHDRTLWLLMHLVGKNVEVQVKSGELYEGVFYTATTEKGLGVLLKMARKKDGSKTSRPIENFLIYPTDFVQLYAKEVPLDIRNEREFSTDTEISSHGGFRERELQPWIPDESLPNNVDLSLGSNNNREDWDQFATNKEKFGVETSWDEKYYTTELNKNSSDFKQKSRDATRIAAEIERSSRGNTNFHVIEERGFEVDIGEEERYGAVIRPVTTPVNNTNSSAFVAGKYVPPQRRSVSNDKGKEDGTSTPDKTEKPDETRKKDTKEDIRDDKAKMSPKDVRKSDIQRVGSTDELGDILASPRSPGSPRSPRSPAPGSETHPVVTERLRLRLHLASERLKNSAPVTSSQNSDFPTANRSPLLSPLIGDARSINALSLEPSQPNLPEAVLNEFFNFSLTAKKSQQEKEKVSFRERSLADLKSFSKSIEKKVPADGKKESSQPTTPRESTPAPEEKENKEKPTSTDSKESKDSKTSTPSKSTTTSTTTPASSTSASASATATAEEKAKSSKLNPNAKAFKPMSASAPSFTPSSVPAPVSIIVPNPEWYQQANDPYFYGGIPRQPMYQVPYPQPMLPNQPVVYPPQVRLVTPPMYSGMPYGQPMVYGGPPQVVTATGAANQGGNQQGKRFVPPTGAVPIQKVPSNGIPSSSSPPQFQGAYVGQPRVMIAPGVSPPQHAAFFPAQYGQGPMLVAQPIETYQRNQPYYPPSEQQQAKEEGSDNNK